MNKIVLLVVVAVVWSSGCGHKDAPPPPAPTTVMCVEQGTANPVKIYNMTVRTDNPRYDAQFVVVAESEAAAIALAKNRYRNPKCIKSITVDGVFELASPSTIKCTNNPRIGQLLEDVV